MVSDKKVKELENSEIELSLTVGADAVKSSYEEVVSKYVKSAHVKGFRKGKVPVKVLETKYGDALKEESMVNLMDEALKEALEELDDKHKPLPYSSPTLLNEDGTTLELGKEFTFSVSYEVYPSLDLKEYSGYEIEVPSVSVTAEDIGKELSALQDQNALVAETDSPAAESSIVTISYWELDDEGDEVEGTKREDFTFTIGSGYNLYQVDEDIIGMKKDDTKVVEKTYPEDFSSKELAGRSVKLHIVMSAVKQRDIPELDDDFAQDISEKYETLDDLKKDIEKRLSDDLETKMKDFRIGKVINKIIEDNPFTVPSSMVEAQVDDSWRNYVAQFQVPEEQMLKFLGMQGMTKEMIMDGWKDDAVFSLKHSIVLQALVDAEKIEVTDEEAEEAFTKEQEASGRQEEELNPKMKDYYVYMQKEQLKNQKAAAVLLEKNSFKDGDVMNLQEFLQGKEE